jgi:hypothetical protein
MPPPHYGPAAFFFSGRLPGTTPLFAETSAACAASTVPASLQTFQNR